MVKISRGLRLGLTTAALQCMSQLNLVCQLLLETCGEQSLGKIGLRRTWRPVPLIVQLSWQDNEEETRRRECWEGWEGWWRGRPASPQHLRRPAWQTSQLHLPLRLLRPLRHCSTCQKRRGGEQEKEGWTEIRCINNDAWFLIFAFRTWERD